MDTKFDFNKTEKFDFGKVGKRMPYSTPDKPVKIERKKRPLMRVMWTAMLAVAASVAVLLVLHIDFSAPHPSQPSQTEQELQAVDQAFAQLSAADQAYLLDVYQEDVFLNN